VSPKRWRPPVSVQPETRGTVELLRCPTPVPQAPEGTTTVLIVGDSRCSCGWCGLAAFPHELSHQALAGYGPDGPGCGAVFAWITVDRPRLDIDARMALTEMRRDLPIISPADALAVRRR
jgi:hypothetical protein